MDKPAAARDGGCISGESHRFPRRDGRARPIRAALPRLRLSRAAYCLCVQRSELLRELSDRWPAARRSLAFAPAARRLAAHPRRARTQAAWLIDTAQSIIRVVDAFSRVSDRREPVPGGLTRRCAAGAGASLGR